MAASTNSSPVHGDRDLFGQTVMVIGCSSGIMTNTAITSATFDIDGGQQLVEA